MSTYIQNYGITKTLIKKNKKIVKNEMKWVGNYDGTQANIKLAIDDNGHKDTVQLQLNNDDLMNLLGVQPVAVPLEQRLINDFLTNQGQEQITSYKPITLDGIFEQSKRKKYTSHNKYTRRNKYKQRKSSKIRHRLH
jgi:hypothetical protein